MIKVFRFLNLLEPGKSIISISKAFLWSTIFSLMWTVVFNPENTTSVLTLMFANFVATSNYVYRRYVQLKAGNTDACAGISNE